MMGRRGVGMRPRLVGAKGNNWRVHHPEQHPDRYQRIRQYSGRKSGETSPRRASGYPPQRRDLRHDGATDVVLRERTFFVSVKDH